MLFFLIEKSISLQISILSVGERQNISRRSAFSFYLYMDERKRHASSGSLSFQLIFVRLLFPSSSLFRLTFV